MNLATFSTEQLHLFALALEAVERQLDEVNPAHLSKEEQERRETLTEQAYVLSEQLDLEMARRSLVSLHAALGADESATFEIASHALVSLQAQLKTEERT
jgi:hypothetical protein